MSNEGSSGVQPGLHASLKPLMCTYLHSNPGILNQWAAGHTHQQRQFKASLKLSHTRLAATAACNISHFGRDAAGLRNCRTVRMVLRDPLTGYRLHKIQLQCFNPKLRDHITLHLFHPLYAGYC